MDFLTKWNRANALPQKTYPHSLWMGELCILVGEDKPKLIDAFRKYLDNAFGENKWVIEYIDKKYTILNHNKKHKFAEFQYRDRNEVDTNKNVVQTEVY